MKKENTKESREREEKSKNTHTNKYKESEKM